MEERDELSGYKSSNVTECPKGWLHETRHAVNAYKSTLETNGKN